MIRTNPKRLDVNKLRTFPWFYRVPKSKFQAKRFMSYDLEYTKNLSLKFQRFTPSGGKNMGIRKFKKNGLQSEYLQQTPLSFN